MRHFLKVYNINKTIVILTKAKSILLHIHSLTTHNLYSLFFEQLYLYQSWLSQLQKRDNSLFVDHSSPRTWYRVWSLFTHRIHRPSDHPSAGMSTILYIKLISNLSVRNDLSDRYLIDNSDNLCFHDTRKIVRKTILQDKTHTVYW